MSIPVIGIAGQIGSGKDVVAHFLQREYRMEIIRFSDALKQEVMDRFPRTIHAIASLNQIPTWGSEKRLRELITELEALSLDIAENDPRWNR